jgi:carbonic anhydrase
MKKLTLLAISFLISTSAVYADVAPPPTVTPAEALKELKEGNARYVSGHSAHPRIDAERRQMTADYGQTPEAAVLGCADSRVPPEIVFDQKFANVFVVRVAGNVCGISELASMEYAVVVVKVPLIVVLGHTKCGAVEAAVDNKELPGSLPQLVRMIRPSVEKAEKEGGSDDLVLRATKENIRHTMSMLTSMSPVIKEAVDTKKVKIVGAIRDIRDGHIDFFAEDATPAAAK